MSEASPRTEEREPLWWLGVWGVLGVALLLGQAIWRLAPLALEALSSSLTTQHMVILIGWTAFSLYTEGYRAFHQRFSPRVVMRARHLAKHPTFFRGLFAPLYCMALFHASRRGKIAAWVVLIMVVILIALIRLVDQPWRGIIDAGVVAALVWGLTSLIYFGLLAILGRPVDVDPQLPSTDPARTSGDPGRAASVATSHAE